jgi:hypothetical protein
MFFEAERFSVLFHLHTLKHQPKLSILGFPARTSSAPSKFLPDRLRTFITLFLAGVSRSSATRGFRDTIFLALN